jgi:glucose/mannose-6-phosphate isomerase
MNELDDPKAYETLDPESMGELIAGFADQCRTAWNNVGSFDLPSSYRQARRLVVLGMGGSAIGGDLLRTLVAAECQVPILVSREYGVPAWVDAQTLAIVSSHSGNTEETMSAMRQASSRGAMLAGVTTDGELGQTRGIPLLRYDFKSQPRAALGFSFVSLLGIVAHLGWISDPADKLDKALSKLKGLDLMIAPVVPMAQNPAKQLASNLFGRIPVMYGGGSLSEVAHRWKTQINENAKMTAFYDMMSELNHNSVVGYEFPPDVLKSLVFVSLLSRRDDERIQKRFDVTRRLINERNLRQQVVQVEGDSVLEEMLWCIHFGDYVSYYLAILNGVDPTPVSAIDSLKLALKQG